MATEVFAQITLVHTSFTYLWTACGQSHLSHLPVGLLQCSSHEVALKVIAGAQNSSWYQQLLTLSMLHHCYATALAPSFFPGTITLLFIILRGLPSTKPCYLWDHFSLRTSTHSTELGEADLSNLVG